ncbi:MAG TPA: hypothetical protein PKV41_03290 [Candidatus Omnitrophota bacterium]|nr:hypothetical protein [Candidatus Omnitrophota bacterium]
MSVVDFLLNSLIKHLQKKQKARKDRKKSKRRFLKRSRKIVRSKRRPSHRPARPKRFRKRLAKRKPAKRLFARKKLRPKKWKIKALSKKKAAVARSHVRLKRVKKIRNPVVRSDERKPAVPEVCIGEITHFFSRIQVVVLKMTGGRLCVGEKVHILGSATDFIQKVGSLQIESVDVKEVRKGQLVGLKVDRPVKVGSKVYKQP